MVTLLPVVAVGGVPATIVILLELAHPAALETVTEYVPAVLTLMQLVLAPVLHKYVVQPAGAQSEIGVPWQMPVPPVMVETGAALTVMVTLFDFWQPVAVIVSVNVYVVVTVGLATGLDIVDELNPVAGVHE